VAATVPPAAGADDDIDRVTREIAIVVSEHVRGVRRGRSSRGQPAKLRQAAPNTRPACEEPTAGRPESRAAKQP
jgi:hypothetical protein